MNAFNKHVDVADKMLSKRGWTYKSELEDFTGGTIVFTLLEARNVGVLHYVAGKGVLPCRMSLKPVRWFQLICQLSGGNRR